MKHQEVNCELRSTKGGVREFIARGGGRGLSGRTEGDRVKWVPVSSGGDFA